MNEPESYPDLVTRPAAERGRGGDVADVPESYRLAPEPEIIADTRDEDDARPAPTDAELAAAADAVPGWRDLVDASAAGPVMLVDVEHGLALVEDADGDQWFRRPDGEYEAVGGPVFAWAELARRHGPLRLVDYTPAPAGPASPPAADPVLGELVTADPVLDPYAALVRCVELVAAGRPAGRLAPGDVTAIAASIARIAFAARGVEVPR